MSEANTLACPACQTKIDARGADPLSRVACPTCGERVRVERAFDHFELVETLGSGGMGTVYKARDTRLDRFVALKLLRKDLGTSSDYAKQLEQEAKVTALINHPNVVQVFSVGNDHEQFYLVMELVDCGNLDDLIEEKKRLPEAEVLRTGIEVAKGLRAAYAKGLIHRDVKPANILFSTDGAAKIVDFGLAGIAEPQGSGSGELWGTPYYVAPERLESAPEDFRSDIYSLGASLFHAIAGRPTFEGDTNSATELRALKERPLKLSEIVPEVSPETSGAIGRMIAPDPRLRFASYDDLIAALEKARRRLLGEKESLRTRILVVLAAAVVLAIAGASWFIVHARPRIPPAGAGVSAKKFDLEGGFVSARRQLLDGNVSNARGAFARVAIEANRQQPIYDWARLNQALAALLDQQESQMQQALREVENAGTAGFADRELGKFLLATARQLNARSTLALSDIPEQPAAARPFALLFGGLMDVQLGRFNDAIALLSAFQASSASGNLSWINDYKSLGEKYLGEARAFVAWRDQSASAKTPAEVRNTLERLRAIIPKLQKRTTIAREAGVEEKMLVNRLGESEAAEKSTQEKEHQKLLARESPRWNAALENFRRHAAGFDFAGAVEALRNVALSEPGLKQARTNYLQAARWLMEWKTTLIGDLNARGFTGPITANNTQFAGIASATDERLRLRTPYGVSEMDWTKVSPAALLVASVSFANDAERKWRCGVFGWAIGAGDQSQDLLDAAADTKPEYKAARSFFAQPKR